MRVHLEGRNANLPLKLFSIGNESAPNNDGYISIVDNNVATVLCTIDDFISKIYSQMDIGCKKKVFSPKY